ncbi:MAG: hypothetical protein EAX96_05690 [Candidatus Lokiarchaeota archaeon]|nr:hypothetical protein [Candidatus Lokiarchaeota archaeon]
MLHELIFLEKIISGVDARRIILQTLLEGPKTGRELRWALADGFDRRIDGVSDALLYFNLQYLENYNVISRKKEWKSKYARIRPEYVQLVRRYFHINPPICIVGALDNDSTHVRDVRMKLRVEQKNMPLPKRYEFIVDKNLKNKFSPLFESVTFKFLDHEIFHNNVNFIYDFVKTEIIIYKKGSDSSSAKTLIEECEPIIDVTCGSKSAILALQKIAHKYNLRCFYIDQEEQIVWI